MSVLETLKLTQKPIISFTAEAQRRQKLIVKLQEQLRLAESALGGNKYMRMRWTTIADADGEPQRVQRAVRMRHWFSKDAAGSVLMTVRYGRRLVEFSKGMNAIQVGDMSALPNVITQLITATLAGELDAQLATIAADNPFAKRIKGTVKLSLKRN